MSRVTQGMMNNSFLRNLEISNQRMEKYQNQLATGKKIVLPEDDPVVATRAMYYKSNMVEAGKYIDNADMGKMWLTQTEDALTDVNSTMQRVRELTVQAANGTLAAEDKKAIQKEIDQLRDHIHQVSNTAVAGRYIFGGTNTLIAPSDITATTETWKGNNGEIKLEIGEMIQVPINTDGTQVFDMKDTDGDNIFATLRKLSDALENDDPVDSFLSKVDFQFNNIIDNLTTIGARSNRLDFTSNRLEGLKISLEDARSNAEDVDSAKVITDMKTEESVYRAALSTGSRILQPSLADFLR